MDIVDYDGEVAAGVNENRYPVSQRNLAPTCPTRYM